MKPQSVILPLPHCISLAKSKINHYSLPLNRVEAKEALSQPVKAAAKHIQPNKTPQTAKTSRLAELEADVFTPEHPTSNGYPTKPKNVNQNRGDKAAMEKYFDRPVAEEKSTATEKWYAQVARELEMQDAQKQKARLDEAKKVWEEYLG